MSAASHKLAKVVSGTMRWVFAALAAAALAEHDAPAGAQLNASTFYETLHAADAGRVFVFFYSPSCGHCRAMMPAWAELHERVAGAARLAAVDAEANKVLADRLDVHGFPTLMVVEAGRLHEYEGDREADEMLQFVSAADLAAVARASRALPRAPSVFDPILDTPRDVVEIVAAALNINPLAAALLAAALLCLGVSLARLLQPLDAPFITVECPEGIQPGQPFVVEFLSGRTPLRPRGRRRHMQVQAPPGIAPGQTFFVPLTPPPQARPPVPEQQKSKGE